MQPLRVYVILSGMGQAQLVRYATFVGAVEGIVALAERGVDPPEITVAKLRLLLDQLHADEAGDPS